MLSSLVLLGQGQIKLIYPDTTNLLNGFKYEGKLKNAVRWVDYQGDNLAIITETGEYPSKIEINEDFRDAELFGYHFLIINDSLIETWKVYDAIKACPLDIETKFINNTFQVTDLNHDNIAEVWLMYKTVCRGDMSPSNMEIIMYQGQQKFEMRGYNKVELPKNESYGGEYKFDLAFINGPKEFRKFAISLWNKHIIEAWE